MARRDEHFARRLHDHARRCIDLSPGALGRGARTEGYVLAVSLLGQALECVFVALVLLKTNEAKTLDKLPRSLVALARLLEQAEARQFSAEEMGVVALADAVHSQGVARALLPDVFFEDPHAHMAPFADQMAREVWSVLQQDGTAS